MTTSQAYDICHNATRKSICKEGKVFSGPYDGWLYKQVCVQLFFTVVFTGSVLDPRTNPRYVITDKTHSFTPGPLL